MEREFDYLVNMPKLNFNGVISVLPMITRFEHKYVSTYKTYLRYRKFAVDLNYKIASKIIHTQVYEFPTLDFRPLIDHLPFLKSDKKTSLNVDHFLGGYFSQESFKKLIDSYYYMEDTIKDFVDNFEKYVIIHSGFVEVFSKEHICFIQKGNRHSSDIQIMDYTIIELCDRLVFKGDRIRYSYSDGLYSAYKELDGCFVSFGTEHFEIKLDITSYKSNSNKNDFIDKYMAMFHGELFI